MKKVFVFDADDTLVLTEWAYSRAYTEYFDYFYKILGDRAPSLHYLITRFFSIEATLFPTWGVRRGRVAEAMALTYIEVCGWVESRFGERVYSADHEKEIRAIGDTPFDHKMIKWFPGAKSCLTSLAEKGHRLCLLTSYDTNVFPSRARFLGYGNFFASEHMRATPQKKVMHDFIQVSGWTKEKDQEALWYAVGNGESDIRPALEISERWRGIYIPHGSTSRFVRHDEETRSFTPPSIVHDRVTTLHSIKELPNLFA